MFFAYVIISSKGMLYTGHTGDLIKRLGEHDSGCCKTTSTNSQWKIIYSKEFPTRGEAMKHEKWLKTGVGRELIKRILNGVESAVAEHPPRHQIFCTTIGYGLIAVLCCP